MFIIAALYTYKFNMKQKILTALKPKAASLGFNNEELEGYAEIIAKNLNSDATDETINAQIDAFLPVLKLSQSAVNRIVNAEKTKTQKEREEAERKAKEEEKAKEEAEGKNKPEWQQAIDALTKNQLELTQSFQSFLGEQNSKTLSQKLSETLKAKNIPEWYANPATAGRTFKDDTEVTSFAETLSNSWETAKQDLANKGFSETTPPNTGDSATLKDSEVIASQIEAETKKIVESNKN